MFWLRGEYASNNYAVISLLISSGRYEEAVRRCDELLRVNPGDTVAQDCKNRALGDVEQAREKLRQSESNLRDDPEDFFSMRNKGTALMQLGRVEEGVAVLDALLEDDPDDCDVMYDKAMALALCGKIAEARKCNALLRKTCPEHYCPTPVGSFIRLGKAANLAEQHGT